MRTVTTISLIVLALILGAAAVTGQEETVNETTVDRSEPSPAGWARDLTRTSTGDWILLESNEGTMSGGHNTGGEVFRHRQDWSAAGNNASLRTGDEEFEPVAVEPNPDGGWFVVARDGRLHQFTAEWEYTGDSRTGDSDHLIAATRTDDGGWWVVTSSTVVHYEGGWNESPTRTSVDTVSTGVNGVYYDRTGLYLIDDVDETVYEFSTDVSDATVLADATPRGVHSLRYGPEPVNGIHRGPEGDWWVLSSEGTVYKYDANWLYTGVTRDVGSDRLPPAIDVVSFGIVSPLIGFFRLALLIAPIALATYFAASGRGRKQSLASGILSIGAAYAVFFPPFPLRPTLFASDYAVIVTACVAAGLPAIAVYGYDSSLRSRLLYALTFSPVFVGGVRWLTAIL